MTSSDTLVDGSGNPLAGDSQVENVQSGQTGTSISRTVPAGTLAADGDFLEFTCWGDGVSSEGVSVSFGSTSIFTLPSISGTDFVITGTIVRKGATSCASGVTGDDDGNTHATATTSITETLANALTLTVSTDGTGAMRVLIVKKWSA